MTVAITNENFRSWTSETTRISDFFQLVMGDHFHWGYFSDETTSFADAQDALVRLLIRRGKVGEQSSVLDLGCGIGGTVRYIARLCKCKATGVTNSARGVEVATARALQDGLDELTDFRVADALNTGLPSDSFDAITIIEAAYLMGDKDALLGECHRMLKAGGSLLIVENMVTRSLTPGEMIGYYREIVALKKMFGVGIYESFESYREAAQRTAFTHTECMDLGQKVFPTIDCMIRLAEDRRALLSEFPEELEDFLTAWRVTRSLCEEGISTYGLLHAVK